MDYRTCLIFCLIGVSILQTINAGCEEKMQNPEFVKTCLGPYGKYMEDITAAGTPVMEGMCTKEGQALMQCLLDVMKGCEPIRTQMAASFPPGLDFNKILDGGIEAMCKLMTGPCSKISECMPSGSPPAYEGDLSKLASVPTPYQVFHISSTMYCRTSKPLFDCLLERLADCPPEIITQAEEMMKRVTEQAGGQDSIVKPMSFEDTRKFITKQCPKMPKSSSNDCMEKSLGSKGFVDCYNNLTQTYTTDAQKKTCKVYFANKKCINDNVLPECDKNVANFLVENSHLIIDGPPSDCEKEDDTSGTSGTGHLQVSVGMSLVMSLLCVLKIFK